MEELLSKYFHCRVMQWEQLMQCSRKLTRLFSITFSSRLKTIIVLEVCVYFKPYCHLVLWCGDLRVNLNVECRHELLSWVTKLVLSLQSECARAADSCWRVVRTHCRACQSVTETVQCVPESLHIFSSLPFHFSTENFHSYIFLHFS